MVKAATSDAGASFKTLDFQQPNLEFLCLYFSQIKDIPALPPWNNGEIEPEGCLPADPTCCGNAASTLIKSGRGQAHCRIEVCMENVNQDWESGGLPMGFDLWRVEAARCEGIAMRISTVLMAGLVWGATTFSMPAIAVTDAVLPSAVQASLNAATSAQDIANLVVGNPGLEATIIANALATGLFDVETIVSAAIETDSSKLAAIVEAATEASPTKAGEIAFEAANAAGLQVGAAGDDASIASVIAAASVRGLEAAFGPDSPNVETGARAVTAELFAFLGDDEKQIVAQAVVDETTIASDTAAGIASDTAAGLITDIETAATEEEDGYEGDALLNTANTNNGGANSGN